MRERVKITNKRNLEDQMEELKLLSQDEEKIEEYEVFKIYQKLQSMRESS